MSRWFNLIHFELDRVHFFFHWRIAKKEKKEHRSTFSNSKGCSMIFIFCVSFLVAIYIYMPVQNDVSLTGSLRRVRGNDHLLPRLTDPDPYGLLTNKTWVFSLMVHVDPQKYGRGSYLDPMAYGSRFTNLHRTFTIKMFGIVLHQHRQHLQWGQP